MSTLKTTFTKLFNGSWGIRSEDDTLVPGDFVEVTKKSGEVSTEEVGSIVKRGDGWLIAEIKSKPRNNSRGGSRGSYRKASWKCKASGCGSQAVDRGYCRSCAFDEFDD